MINFQKVIFFSIIFLTFFSCKKEDSIDLSQLQTFHNLAIPLVSAEIDVEDMYREIQETLLVRVVMESFF